VNKRARNRLIVVTGIILVAVAAIIVFTNTGSNAAAFEKTVGQVAADNSFIGKRVQVSGVVVPGSWNKGTDPMRFTISDAGKTSGPTVKIVYAGTVPNTFGDNNGVTVTGKLDQGYVMKAEKMVVKCPSKYESGTSALGVDGLLLMKKTATGQPSKVMGYVVAGSLGQSGAPVRFSISSTAAGSSTKLPVKFDGALPAEFKDGVKVVVGGTLDKGGVYDATSVALDSSQKK
jgi:cytochrome c-type biogenesis protein CcmE